MPDDFEIGRVIAVDSAQVTIQLNKDLKALSRTTYEGVFEVGRINSYVIFPVGAHRLVGMVTRIVLAEDADIRADRTMVTLPSTRRVIKATLIGTLSGHKFAQGVSVFPILDSPVHFTTTADLNLIFDRTDEVEVSSDHPGFCINIGESEIFSGYPIKIDPDAFFGKHAAVLGSTGSGKSCTIASIIQSILSREEIHRSNFIILDTNGEYRSAFQKQDTEGKWENAGSYSVLYVPSDPSENDQRLAVPYWFLNAEDFVRLFRASQGVQRPVLLDALRLARSEESEQTKAQILRENIIRELNRIFSLSESDGRNSKELDRIASGLLNLIKDKCFDDTWSDLPDESQKGALKKALKCVIEEAENNTDGAYPGMIPVDSRKVINEKINPIYTALTNISLSENPSPAGLSADSPAFFHKAKFRTQHIEQALRREESSSSRAREASGTMLLRIDRLLADTRFDFLLGPTNAGFPNPEHGLATFLRDILGMSSCENPSPRLSSEEDVPSRSLPFYDRQRTGSKSHNVVILDLSLLAAEVLENVTALVGRLVLEFLQHLGETAGKQIRGSFPVVLVLEEAQNYIKQQQVEDESISRLVFERIAREGRKYGLGLVVASQRPSELSRTVLSQCSSFIVHRLQNPEDLRYFKDIVPGIYEPLLNQLPMLSPQTALVLGECVRAPTIARIREAQPLPQSRDPRFYKYWTQEADSSLDIESICARWEGKDNSFGESPPTEVNNEEISDEDLPF